MKYIDADILSAKVTDLCFSANFLKQKAMEESNREDFVSVNGEIFAYAKVLSLIKSLQQEQPEVDLDFEKEMDSYYGMYRKDGKTYDIEEGEECEDWKEMFDPYNTFFSPATSTNLGNLKQKRRDSMNEKPCYSEDIMHCYQHECCKRYSCYRYWLGQEARRRKIEFVWLYRPKQPVTDGCECFINLND